jgi:hypothetical protein
MNSNAPILDPQHWPQSWTMLDEQTSLDLQTYRKGFIVGKEAAIRLRQTLTSPEPCSVFAIGDGEMGWWHREILSKIDGVHTHWLDELSYLAGFTKQNRLDFGLDFLRAINRLPFFLLINDSNNIPELMTYYSMKAYGMKFEDDCIVWDKYKKEKIDCNVVYQLYGYNEFFPILEGHKILLISGYSKELTELLNSKDFKKAHDASDYEIVRYIQCPAIGQEKKEFMKEVRKQIAINDWTLMLSSAGAMSAILCDYALDEGKKGFDIGAIGMMLLGYRHPCTDKNFKVEFSEYPTHHGLGI